MPQNHFIDVSKMVNNAPSYVTFCRKTTINAPKSLFSPNFASNGRSPRGWVSYSPAG